MNDLLRRSTAALVLAALCTAAQAIQICRDDIPATAPDSRFTNNGNGTVSDAAIGLMWKQCVEGLSGARCDSGSAATYTWQQALQLAANSEFAGYSDWRLANKHELALLVERRCIQPAVNAWHFPNTPSSSHWSSSPQLAWLHRGEAWVVDFSEGFLVTRLFDWYSDRPYVRLVRIE